MCRDLVDAARRKVERIERGDETDPWIAEVWWPLLDDFAGPDRTVTTARQVTDVMVRVVLDGGRGRAFVSVLFDETDKVVGLDIDTNEQDGKFWIVVDSPPAQHDELRAFYATLTGAKISADEDLTRPPRWRDPANPAQLHLDIFIDDRPGQ